MKKLKSGPMVSASPTHGDCVGAYLSNATLDPLPAPSSRTKVVFCCFLNIPTKKVDTMALLEISFIFKKQPH